MRPHKRQKTDPSPVKPDTKTLFHFFSKRRSYSNAVFEPSPPKTPDSLQVKDEVREESASKLDDTLLGIKPEDTPPKTEERKLSFEKDTAIFDGFFTGATNLCSPAKKEDQNNIDQFDTFGFQYEEFKDCDFRDEELDFRDEEMDDIEDDFENDSDENQSSKPSTVNTSVQDDSPSCPFCSFSFKGLSEELITLHANKCLDNLPQSPPRKSLAWTARKPQLQPPGTTPTSSLFSKIMAANTEDKAWKAAAITEQLRGIRAAVRPCPFYKIMPEMPGFAVDAFRYGKVDGIRGYFLTHFHSDHYGGMTANWTHGKIYCSSVTGELVLQQIKVDPEFIVKLPLNETVHIEGVDVTLIEANHCPGSVLFLFEKKMGKKVYRILHCGDFRASPIHINHPAIKGKFIDAVYLDTTYLNPKYAFPAQEDVINACAQKCQLLSNEDSAAYDNDAGSMTSWIKNPFSSDKPKGRLLVVVGTYSIGKERIVLGIAKALRTKVYASTAKRRICACLEDEELMGLLTDDPLEGQVHMTGLAEIRAETLQQYLNEFKPHFARVVGFRPTGWTYSPPISRSTDSPTVHSIIQYWNTTFTHQQLNPQRGSTSTAVCFGAPYSEHSSFRDLTCFCCALEIGRIVPTVNVHTAKSREKMRAWIEKWNAYKKKEGRLNVDVGQTRW